MNAWRVNCPIDGEAEEQTCPPVKIAVYICPLAGRSPAVVEFMPAR